MIEFELNYDFIAFFILIDNIYRVKQYTVNINRTKI